MATRVAILGAGIFAREEHLPAIQSTPGLSLIAIYSRSQASAEALALGSGLDVYYDSPSSGNRSLRTLLARHDLDAVVIALPIIVQPDIIRQALEAGKHVLSEKPIAKDGKTAMQLIDWYRAQPSPPIWGVAENFRFIGFVTCAAAQLARVGGSVVSFSMTLYAMIEDDNKFYNTDWRRTPDYQGGFLLDGGVHFVAGMRALLDVFGESVGSVSCVSGLLQEKLAPVDTLQSIWRLRSGKAGSFICSFGMVHKAGLALEVITDKGCVTATPTKVTVKTGDVSEDIAIEAGSGVAAELEAFRDSITSREPNARQIPEEAHSDLQLLEAMLRSGEDGGAVKALHA